MLLLHTKYKFSLRKLSFFLVFGLSFSRAQNNISIFTIKPVVGINVCQMHGDNAHGFHKFGFNGGILLNTRINQKTSFDFGMVFTQKGARKNQNPTKGDYTFYRVNLNYIELPLLLNYKANETYFITIGPSIAYLINYQEDTERGNWNGVYPFNKFEFAANFGLGRKLKKNLLVEVRSTNSFIPVRGYGNGFSTSGIYYPSTVARFFNKGLYNIILSAYITYQIDPRKKNESINP